MPRCKRLVIEGEPGCYHVACRTVLPELPFKDADKGMLLSVIKRYSELYFIDILCFSIMSDHFHLVLRTLPEDNFTDDGIVQKLQNHYGESCDVSPETILFYRNKLSALGEFMKEVKQGFTVYFNRKYGRKGTLWDARYKSLIVENGEALLNCMAYVELNPVRAELTDTPEAYSWNSLNYRVRNANRGPFLSTDIGISSFTKISKKKWLDLYLKFVHDAGAMKNSGKNSLKKLREGVREKIEKNNTKRNRAERFLVRNRYFTDAGVIGSKAFVSEMFEKFYDVFKNPGNRSPKRIQGLDGIYSLKRLKEEL